MEIFIILSMAMSGVALCGAIMMYSIASLSKKKQEISLIICLTAFAVLFGVLAYDLLYYPDIMIMIKDAALSSLA